MILRLVFAFLLLCNAGFAQNAPQISVQAGHGSYVYALAVAPRGDLYATGDDGGTIKVWTRPAHEVLLTAHLGDGKRITRLLFAPDGKTLVAVGEGGMAAWTLPNGRALWRKPGIGSALTALAFARDGTELIVVNHREERLVLNVATGSQISKVSLKTGSQKQALSPDGKLLATDGHEPGGNGGPPSRGVIFEGQTGKNFRMLRGVRGGLIALQFSPDGTKVFTSSLDGTEITNGRPANWGQIFAATTGELLRSIRLFDDSDAIMPHTSWSPDGKLLATVGTDYKKYDGFNSLKIWDAATGKLLREVSDTERMVSRNLPSWISNHELLLATVRSEKGVFHYGAEEFDTETGKGQLFFAPLPMGLGTPRWSPDGRFLTARGAPDTGAGALSGSVASLRLWDMKSGVPSPAPFTFDCEKWRWTPDLSLLITERLSAWKWPSGPLVSRYEAPLPNLPPNATQEQQMALRAAMNAPGGISWRAEVMDTAPDNRTIAAGSVNASLRFAGTDPGPGGLLTLWDAQTNVLTVLERQIDVTWLAFSPDGKHLAALVSAAAPQPPGAEKKPFESVPREAFIEVWDVGTRQRVARLACAAQRTKGIDNDWGDPQPVGWLDAARLLLQIRKLSQDRKGDTIYTTHLEAWNFAADKRESYAPLPAGQVPAYDGLDPAEVSAQGDFLLLRDSKTCRWLALRDGRAIGSVPFEASRWPGSPALSPDRKLVALAKSDGTIELWLPAMDVNKATLVATLTLLTPAKPGAAPDWLVWTPAGNFDGSPGALAKIRWRQDGKLLPGAAFASRRRAGLLGQLAR